MRPRGCSLPGALAGPPLPGSCNAGYSDRRLARADATCCVESAALLHRCAGKDKPPHRAAEAPPGSRRARGPVREDGVERFLARKKRFFAEFRGAFLIVKGGRTLVSQLLEPMAGHVRPKDAREAGVLARLAG